MPCFFDAGKDTGRLEIGCVGRGDGNRGACFFFFSIGIECFSLEFIFQLCVVKSHCILLEDKLSS